MANRALFAGLIFDENDKPVEVGSIGNEAAYVINDAGFKHHIPSEDIDRQVLKLFINQIQGNEEIIAQQAIKMMGKDDLFTHAIILNQLKQVGTQIENLFKLGIPEEGRAYLGMMGFRITINMHGEIVSILQPGTASDEGDGGS